MSKVHVIAMDTHSQTTDICVKTRVDGPCRRWHVKTSIPAIVEVLGQIKGPRELVIEEGPMAGWLLRNLRMHVEKALACDPRQNALIANGGGSDKDDAIDAMKLCDLHLGRYTREVHHAESLEREVNKQAVGLYHERVGNRVRGANKVMGLLKQMGIMVKEKDFQKKEGREAVLAAWSNGSPAEKQSADHVWLLLGNYDQARMEEAKMRQEVVRMAKQQEVVVRWEQVPGIGWIRGMTLLAYLDTPWRFKSNQALWKYMGIGLVRERSGHGPVRVHVAKACNYLLKGTIVGAAETVIKKKQGGFYRRYEHWMSLGMSFKNARRNVARDIAATIWSMWKNGRKFDERFIGGGLGDCGHAGGNGLSSA